QTECRAWFVCEDGTTQSVAPTDTRDRVCSACGAGQFADDGECKALTVCQNDEYESIQPAADRDRVCSPLTECAQGSYQVREPSSTVDRGCMPCASGTFSTMINA